MGWIDRLITRINDRIVRAFGGYTHNEVARLAADAYRFESALIDIALMETPGASGTTRRMARAARDARAGHGC